MMTMPASLVLWPRPRAAARTPTDRCQRASALARRSVSDSEGWGSLIAADPGMADVPLTEIGHSISAEDGISQTAEWFR